MSQCALLCFCGNEPRENECVNSHMYVLQICAVKSQLWTFLFKSEAFWFVQPLNSLASSLVLN